MEDKYEFGKCGTCKKETWLRNGKCIDCYAREPQSDVVDSIMRMFGNK